MGQSPTCWLWGCYANVWTNYRGKTLGGSSSINGGHWTRGLNVQYDSWSQLLEEDEASVGWNWDGIFSYMKKVIAWNPIARSMTEPDWLCRRRRSLRPTPNNKPRAPPPLHHTMAQPDPCK